GLVNSHPDRQHRVTAHILEDHDRHIRNRVHHETANFHFYFHHKPLGIAECPLSIAECALSSSQTCIVMRFVLTIGNRKLAIGNPMAPYTTISPSKLLGKLAVTNTGT